MKTCSKLQCKDIKSTQCFLRILLLQLWTSYCLLGYIKALESETFHFLEAATRGVL